MLSSPSAASAAEPGSAAGGSATEASAAEAASPSAASAAEPASAAEASEAEAAAASLCERLYCVVDGLAGGDLPDALRAVALSLRASGRLQAGQLAANHQVSSVGGSTRPDLRGDLCGDFDPSDPGC